MIDPFVAVLIVLGLVDNWILGGVLPLDFDTLTKFRGYGGSVLYLRLHKQWKASFAPLFVDGRPSDNKEAEFTIRTNKKWG